MVIEVDRHDEHWAAVCARDANADGRFVFAVRTTGIFCRPQCAARRPLRANVEFFPTPGAAQAAGFRACKRCRPGGRSVRNEHAEIAAAACRAIAAADAPLTLRELAATAGMSPFHFQRTFKRIVGVTPREYAAGLRADALQRDLPGAERVIDAVYEAGFGSLARAQTLAPSTLGMPASAFRRHGRGERVRYAALMTPLGWLAVAMTERGVASIELGDTRAAVCARIEQRFSAADVAEDGAGLGAVIAAVLHYIERPAGGLDLPLDVQGTAFARRVWRALMLLEPGQTATYAEIARAIGRPSAARAVAAACAANTIALAIPCHRVVPAAGGPGGYRWGAERKRALLAAEAAGVAAEPDRARDRPGK